MRRGKDSVHSNQSEMHFKLSKITSLNSLSCQELDDCCNVNMRLEPAGGQLKES